MLKILSRPLFALMLLLSIGCNNESPSQSQPASSPKDQTAAGATQAYSQSSASTESEEAVVKDWDYYQAYLQQVPKEDLNDPDQWSDFRLEFEWVPVGAHRHQTRSIYSMKRDGSDIRLAAGPELLLGERTFFRSRLRSPNNRYIALHANAEEQRDAIAIVDLLKQETKVIDSVVSLIRFTWSQDSKHLYFYGSRGLTKYIVETGELIDVEPSISASRVFELFDGNYLAINSYDYTFYTPDKKILFQAKIPEKTIGNSGRFGISPDFRYFFVSSGVTCVYDLEYNLVVTTPYECFEDTSPGQIDLLNKGLIQASDKIEIFGFDKKDSKVLYVDDDLYVWNIKVINRQLSMDSRPSYPYLQ